MWKLGSSNMAGLDTLLPVDRAANHSLAEGATPDKIHSMIVNTLNFCSFAWCWSEEGQDSVLLALPHTLDSESIDIFQFQLSSLISTRLATIPAPNLEIPKTGLTMCLALPNSSTLIAGYESGHTLVYKFDSGSQYSQIYVSRPHSQPILSLALHPGGDYYITTAADSVIARHKIGSSTDLQAPESQIITRHAGQQGISFRDDGTLFATAGWDGRGRVYRAGIEGNGNTKKMKEVAVLKWHNEGCYTTAFAHVLNGKAMEDSTSIIQQSTDVFKTASQRRDEKATTTHWLALGSKDGKISLWDIF
jgi:ASTRA-associated protein 1